MIATTANTQLWFNPTSSTPDELTAAQWHWLCNKDSLTTRLQNHFKAALSFHVTQAGWGNIHDEERKLLSLADDKHWIRTIEWRTFNKLLVAARVVIPHTLMNSTEIPNAFSSNESIGKFLFGKNGFTRNEMLLASIPPSHPYYQLAINHTQTNLWARRSIFQKAAAQLLVSEVFLPAFLQEV